MSLSNLANELLLAIAGYLPRGSDINAFAQTSRQLYFAVNLFLYRQAIQQGNNSGLLSASFNGNYALANMLLEIGANPHATSEDKSHRTALHLASAEGHIQIVDALVQAGANIDAVTSSGLSPLHEAVLSGFPDITRLLLDYGADPSKKLGNNDEANVLHLASYWGLSEIAQLILEKGISTEVKDRYQRTPLHYALNYDKETTEWPGNVTTVMLLLEHKADKEAWDTYGQRPMDLARAHPSTIIKVLLENGPDASLERAIKVEQRVLERKKREEAKIRKWREEAVDRSAKRIERLRSEAEYAQKYSVLKSTESSQEQASIRELEDVLAESLRMSKQKAVRESWAEVRLMANPSQWCKIERNGTNHENTVRNQEASPTRSIRPKALPLDFPPLLESWPQIRANSESLQASAIARPTRCNHPALGWLKCKGKTPCERCGDLCTKVSFRCGDCSIRVCAKCKDGKLRR